MEAGEYMTDRRSSTTHLILEYINVSRPAIISWWAGLDELTLSLEEWESWCTRRDKEETSGADLTFPIFLEL